jgi:DNA-binding NarL/FixJ family response regulator
MLVILVQKLQRENVLKKKESGTLHIPLVNGAGELKVYSQPLGTLTSREAEILNLLMSGLKRPKIADTLSISTETVNTHMKHIHSKLTVHSDIELIARAIKEKLV